MHFSLNENIYATYCGNQVVCLDILKDEYIFLSEDLSASLNLVLKKKFRSSILNISEDLRDHFTKLQQSKILSPLPNKNHLYKILKNNESSGTSSLFWKLNTKKFSKSKISWMTVLEAYLYLWFVHIMIKAKKLSYLINMLKKHKHESFEPIYDENTAHLLMQTLNNACLFYPKKVKCLEWSITLVLLALKKKLRCNLVIGIQTLPFFAHAWVQSNKTVLADNENLSKEISIILSEPFDSEKL